MAKLDLTGQVFGKLKVLGLDEEKSTSNRKYWNCQCECGNTISTRADYLRGGKTLKEISEEYGTDIKLLKK